MRRILLLLMVVLLAAPVFGARVTKHHPHPAGHHAKNARYPKKRGRPARFQQARVHKERHKLKENHPKNPNLPKQRKAKKSRKHKS
jgi:hypothetical protein